MKAQNERAQENYEYVVDNPAYKALEGQNAALRRQKETFEAAVEQWKSDLGWCLGGVREGRAVDVERRLMQILGLPSEGGSQPTDASV